MASSLLEVVSSGPKTRKLFMFSFITSRRKTPSGRVFSAHVFPGLSNFISYSRKSGSRSAFFTRPPLAWGFALMRRLPVGASSRNSAARLALSIEQLFRAAAIASSFSRIRNCSGSFFTFGSGT